MLHSIMSGVVHTLIENPQEYPRESNHLVNVVMRLKFGNCSIPTYIHTYTHTYIHTYIHT